MCTRVYTHMQASSALCAHVCIHVCASNLGVLRRALGAMADPAQPQDPCGPWPRVLRGHCWYLALGLGWAGRGPGPSPPQPSGLQGPGSSAHEVMTSSFCGHMKEVLLTPVPHWDQGGSKRMLYMCLPNVGIFTLFSSHGEQRYLFFSSKERHRFLNLCSQFSKTISL